MPLLLVAADGLGCGAATQAKLDMNCLPPPHEPLFQADFEGNMAELIMHIHGFMASTHPGFVSSTAVTVGPPSVRVH